MIRTAFLIAVICTVFGGCAGEVDDVDPPSNGSSAPSDGTPEREQEVRSSTLAVISARPFGCGGSHVALRASTGHFVVAEGDGGAMNANRAAIGPWETFVAHDVGGGQIALQTLSGLFVCAENGGGGPIYANRSWLGPWETFGLERHWNGRDWALRTATNHYVVAEGGGGREMNANRTGVGPWEAFAAICL